MCSAGLDAGYADAANETTFNASQLPSVLVALLNASFGFPERGAG